MEKQERLHQLIPTLILAFILLAGTGVFFWQAGFFDRGATCSKEDINLCTTENICKSNNLYWWDNACRLVEKPKPSEYPDYDSLSSLNKLTLVSDFNTYTPKTEPLEKNTINGVILKNGELSKGYLEIIALINGKPLTIWESIYFKAPYDRVNHYEYGGHIFRPESLKVPPSEKTHLLFALNNIPFLPHAPYRESAQPSRYDLFDIINRNYRVKFLTFISSLTPAEINTINIYYECNKDVNDGKCELTLEK